VSESNPYRRLPAVDELVQSTSVPVPHVLLVEIAREILERAREAIGEGRDYDVDLQFEMSVRAMQRSAGVPVMNATGVLLHTNLGRAPWPEAAAQAAAAAATTYGNVELDLESGERGRRGSYLSRLLVSLTGAEDAMAVNNNAAALLLAMSATSSGRAVPVARGELIEIGGSYRLPDVIEASGARLVEVGTTNRTRVGDYETATQLHDCGSILKVHPSNYRVEGFTGEAGLESLAALASRRDIPLIFDIGSGLLDSETPWLDTPTPDWLRDEPAARQAISAGADLVTFSGDKLLGGPQAGLIVGSAKAVETLRSHPLARALRIDGSTIAALTATLHMYARSEASEIPFWRKATTDPSDIEGRAKKLADALGGDLESGSSTVGAGSVPGMTIPTTLVVLKGEDRLFRHLLARDEPILARRERGSLVIDLRTVDPDEDDTLIEAVTQCR
jgi:L-seryl-tRNA(Ser) seleniumtransferase